MNDNLDFTVVKTCSGFAVVVPDRLSGWKKIGKPFYADRQEAAVTSGRDPNARVVGALRETVEYPALHQGPPQRVRMVSVDWNACLGSRRTGGHWYAVRTEPTAQRTAKRVVDAEPHRIQESVVERNLRNAGFEVYMPAFKSIYRHHRTKKLMEKRFPLLVGYAFIHLDGKSFEDARDVDGVADFLKIKGRPLRFNPEDLGVVMLAADKLDRDFAVEREFQRSQRRGRLNNQLKGFLPGKGRGMRLNMKEQATAALASLSNAARARVKAILAEMEELGEHDRAHLQAA